jgi:peptidoglycan/xylan/chitin deacetylase (PgdA/CDA1 family)
MPRFSTLVFALSLSLPVHAAVPTPVATILCYHEVDAAPSHDTIPRRTASADVGSEQLRYTATPAQFREELDYLDQHGYHVVPLAQLVDALSGRGEPLPEKAVVITVDDGWSCAYTEIYPELRRRKLPWTLFVYPHIVGRGAHALTWKQIDELAAAGVDVESHTYTHAFLTLKDNGNVTPEKYPEFLDRELDDSRKTIEEKIEKPVRFLSYPYGSYDDAVIAEAKNAGYTAAVTTRRAPVTTATSPFELTRYLIHHDTTIEEFKSFLLP